MTKFTIFGLTILLLTTSCNSGGNKNQSSVADNKSSSIANKFLPLGFNALGYINPKSVDFYTFERKQWALEPQATFTIPDGNDGLLPLGLNALGVIKGKQIDFYTFERKQWTLEPQATFTLPN